MLAGGGHLRSSGRFNLAHKVRAVLLRLTSMVARGLLDSGVGMAAFFFDGSELAGGLCLDATELAQTALLGQGNVLLCKGVDLLAVLVGFGGQMGQMRRNRCDDFRGGIKAGMGDLI